MQTKCIGRCYNVDCTQYIQNLDFDCIAYSKGNNGTFVAIGGLYENSKYVYMTTSTDEVTWTTKEPLKDESGTALTYVYGMVAMP